ncbi:MAG TPA: hypothetical protein DEO86_11890 [Colwellia sp.]|nr:hypothetical protein [Colwellia sp.]
MQRINYLDGHRGLAILLVVFYHAYSRWTDILPYQAVFSDFPLFKFGFLGVQLFFLLSGYVILMTLEKCSTIQGFIYQRWLRLFPAMFICSMVIFFSSGFFVERPLGEPQISNLIPGLTFIEPYILTKLIGISFSSLEGTFWSLYVEFKFYIIAALLYFIVGSHKLVFALFSCLGSWVILSLLTQYTDNMLLSYIHSIFHLLSFEYFGWFSAGAAFYLTNKEENNNWFALGIVFCVISSVILAIQKESITLFIAIMSLSFFFAISLKIKSLQSLLSHRFLVFMGFVSYPLYLLHENMMIALILKLSPFIPANTSFILPLLAISFIILLSYLIALYFEKPLKKAIKLFSSLIIKKYVGHRSLKENN